MKSYFQGLITGGVLVFSFIVLTGQTGSPLENLGRMLKEYNTREKERIQEAKDAQTMYIGLYQNGMMKLNENRYFSWITDTRNSSTIVQDFDLEEARVNPKYKGKFHYFSLETFYKEYGKQIKEEEQRSRFE